MFSKLRTDCWVELAYLKLIIHDWFIIGSRQGSVSLFYCLPSFYFCIFWFINYQLLISLSLFYLFIKQQFQWELKTKSAAVGGNDVAFQDATHRHLTLGDNIQGVIQNESHIHFFMPRKAPYCHILSDLIATFTEGKRKRLIFYLFQSFYLVFMFIWFVCKVLSWQNLKLEFIYPTLYYHNVKLMQQSGHHYELWVSAVNTWCLSVGLASLCVDIMPLIDSVHWYHSRQVSKGIAAAPRSHWTHRN